MEIFPHGVDYKLPVHYQDISASLLNLMRFLGGGGTKLKIQRPRFILASYIYEIKTKQTTSWALWNCQEEELQYP